MVFLDLIVSIFREQLKLKQSASQFYDTFSENIDFWVKTLYSEAIETANDIWKNAQPHAQEFLDDIGLVCLQFLLSVLISPTESIY